MQPKVAVVSPFFNSNHHTKGFLSRMALQTYSNFKLFLVDDASVDGTAESLQRLATEFQVPFDLISLPQNVGPAKARNIAIEKALAENFDLILLLDADCRVEPKWIAMHVEAHGQLKDVAMVGGAIQGKADTFIGKADGFASWFTVVPKTKSGLVKRLHLSSTNLSIKAFVFTKIGFFEEKLATGEDVVFCRRAQQAGLILWKQPHIIVTHLDREYFPEAKRHHYRWGLHSYPISLHFSGGYYDVLRKIKWTWAVAGLVPLIAILNTCLVISKNLVRKPWVLWYVPGIFLLKWWNAKGVYDGFLNPKRALRPNLSLS